jgi:molybdopterin-binding protein
MEYIDRVHSSTTRPASKLPVNLPAEKVTREYIREVCMRISARNILKGKVKKVIHGAVNSEIVVELPGGAEVVSIITKESAESLGLKEGKDVYAVIKASNVMIGVD